jgi:hypothetical protein
MWVDASYMPEDVGVQSLSSVFLPGHFRCSSLPEYYERKLAISPDKVVGYNPASKTYPILPLRGDL